MNYFLEIFIDFFIFLNSNLNLNFSTGCYRWYRYRTPAVTAVYRAVTTGKKTLGVCLPCMPKVCARQDDEGPVWERYGST
jgi:hypothetical protein